MRIVPELTENESAGRTLPNEPIAIKPAEAIVPPLRDIRRPPRPAQSHGLGIDPELFKQFMPNFVLNLPDYYPPPVKGVAPGQPGPGQIPGGRNIVPPSPQGPTHPPSFDWRTSTGRNCITPIRDQEQCGSCVAFGTTALLEAMVRIERNLWVDLSEADLFEGGGSCQNGWMANSAISRIMSNGVPLERELPYPPGATETTVINQLPGDGTIALAIKAANDTVFYNSDSRKNYLSTTGPMVACMDVYKDFKDFPGGEVYHYDGTSVYEGGHCLLVIGYDDNAGCWIVKNSWSTRWADGGFARIGYGECGIDGDSPFLAWNFGSPFWGLTSVELPDDYRFEIWADRFLGGTLDDVAVYDAAMDQLYVGSNGGGNFQWSAGMSVSGEPTLRRPKIFAGSFTGSWESTLLVYDAVTMNWGSWDLAPSGPTPLTTVGNTSGFGDIADGRPFWKGYFSALDREQVLFYFPGDGNWWVGTLANGQLTWQNAGNSAQFGNMADGRPLLMADFDGTGRHVFLSYYPAQNNWWLGTMASGSLVWSVVGPSPTFTPLPGARFFSGYFRGVFQSDLLVYSPLDLTWRVGTMTNGRLVWSVAGNSAQFGILTDGRALVGGRFTAAAAGILFQSPVDSSWQLGTLDANGQLAWANQGAGASPAILRSPIQVTGTFAQSWQDALLVQDQDLGSWWLGTVGSGSMSWQNLGGQPFMRS